MAYKHEQWYCEEWACRMEQAPMGNHEPWLSEHWELTSIRNESMWHGVGGMAHGTLAPWRTWHGYALSVRLSTQPPPASGGQAGRAERLFPFFTSRFLDNLTYMYIEKETHGACRSVTSRALASQAMGTHEHWQ